MSKELHVVLGASGAVGQAVIAELKTRNICHREVRFTKNVPGENFKADLLDLKQIMPVVEGATHVYLCIGLTYNSKVWMECWPRVMENVIKACEHVQAKLIYLDNIYMYGPTPLTVPFDETHSQNPVSRKGKARQKTTDLLLQACNSERVKAVIGRSADFYGPGAVNSSLYTSFLQRMLDGKAPMFIGKGGVKHTYAYTGDVGKALVCLALDEACYGQVWHLPASEPLTIEEITTKLNKILGSNYSVSIMPGFLFSVLTLFVPILRELKEMIYQFTDTYVMNSDKFKKHFPDFKPTQIDKGLKAMVESFKV